MSVSIADIFIKKFLKKIKAHGKAEITEDLKYLNLMARVKPNGDFKIVGMTIINSSGDKEKIDMDKFNENGK